VEQLQSESPNISLHLNEGTPQIAAQNDQEWTMKMQTTPELSWKGAHSNRN